ncbi:MAG: DUF333 domain-containing protein [Candidatus ainarchaeum sp.]|nr:DUF333 domain-containing protein [Candidatus ainarchaeum sp.]
MNKSLKIALIAIGIILVLFLVYIIFFKTRMYVPQGEGNDNVQIANPASVNCDNLGGTLDFRTFENGTYGVCVFEDGSECEEWKLFNNECQKGEFINLNNLDPNRFCTLEYVPVCAVNGVTYSNTCLAGEIPILKEGSC